MYAHKPFEQSLVCHKENCIDSSTVMYYHGGTLHLTADNGRLVSVSTLLTKTEYCCKALLQGNIMYTSDLEYNYEVTDPEIFPTREH